MRHLESQRSLLALGKDAPGLSQLAKKLRLAPDQHVAVLNAPPGYLAKLAPAPADLYTAWWTKRDVLGEFTGETGYRPIAFVKIDDNWTALRFKKT